MALVDLHARKDFKMTAEDMPDAEKGVIKELLLDGWHVSGWKLVPIEPTAEMVSKGNFNFDDEFSSVEGIYRAMLSASPTSPSHDNNGWLTLVDEAKAEAEKAIMKFPQPNYVISKIAEEAGEVVKAAIHCAESRETWENLREEMKQCIAMLYRLWIEGDQIHGLPPAPRPNKQDGNRPVNIEVTS